MNETTTKGIESVTCNLCGRDDTRVRFQIPVRPDQAGVFGRDVWDIVVCNNCGLTYTNPRPDAAALAAYYAFDNAYDSQFIQEWFIEADDLRQPVWQRLLRLLGEGRRAGRLLDIGCGTGSFLVAARQAGYEVVGQEVAPFFIEFCRREQGLEILTGEVMDVDLPDDHFDAITAQDVIEHHPDPAAMLRAMHRLLRPGGIGMLVTHDIGNFYARGYGPKWRHLNPIGHLTYFDRRTLAALARQCGFDVVRVGGLHTIDNRPVAEIGHWLVQFSRSILFRSLILGLYIPLTNRLPVLTRWQFKLGSAIVNHKKLLTRTGRQIIMNDDMVLLITPRK